MDNKFLKPYDPKETEKRIYELWEKSGFFNPDECVKSGITDKSAPFFSIVLPPPNVTGTLHNGHALMLAIEDIMVRFNRMRGNKTLWVPGTDHAAISTESVVVKLLSKEKKNKRDLGRDKFLDRVNEFAKNSHDTIVAQLKQMGASLDWSREAFTLDKEREKAVYTAFKKMFDEGLIYRKERVVNWDPKGQTTISDDEVDHEERDGKLYTFKYSKDFPFAIATTRPETKLGDTGVAVHPDDARYKKYIGRKFSFNFAGQDVTVEVVADTNVDPEFGTGALGVTPAHSAVDFEIAQKNNLPSVQIIDEFAKMMVGMDGVKGQKTEIAREAVVAWLDEEGLLEKTENIKQNVSLSQRTKALIEPLPKLQWWIDVNKKIPSKDGKSLKDLILEAVREKKVEILPERFEKTYFNWVENLRDWCISRQIWYGHRIPVWYRNDKTYCDISAPTEEGWVQDEDTLDTWFSSGLWTFSTLGWPNKTDDLKNFHPTSVLETGYDILFFWVARMILMSTYLLDEVPFKTVYLHGMVLDKNGKKMSKSNPETAIDPLVVIEKFGADALRMAMIVGVGPGQNVTLSDDKINAYKKFSNKIWNAARFVIENTSDLDAKIKPKLTPDDENALKELDNIIFDITNDIEKYRYYMGGEKIYHYFWHTFADIIIEKSKKSLADKKTRVSAQWTLLRILETCLTVIHPFMPFVTEEIWQLMGHKNLLMIERWPDKIDTNV